MLKDEFKARYTTIPFAVYREYCVYKAFRLIAHHHKEIEFISMTEGRADFYVDNIRYELKKGDILFTVDTDAVARKIETELPHAISVKVERDYPGTLRISMQQTEAEFCFEISGQYVVVSKELKVLCVLEGKEELESSYGPLIPIKIPPIRNAVAGHTLVFMDERDTDFIPELLYTLEVCKLRDKITSIDASVRFDIRLFYMDRLEIKLGNTEEFETKLIFARQIAEKFKEGTTGTISVEDPEEGFALVDQPENLIS